MTFNNTTKLIISILLCELAGVVGSVFTLPAIPNWYAGLARPALNPMAWVFGPVWTMLFFSDGNCGVFDLEKGNRSEGCEKSTLDFCWPARS